MMDAGNVVDTFGGAAAISEALGISESAVRNWPSRGSIPGKWHLVLLRLARDKGVDLGEGDLLSMTSRGKGGDIAA